MKFIPILNSYLSKTTFKTIESKSEILAMKNTTEFTFFEECEGCLYAFVTSKFCF